MTAGKDVSAENWRDAIKAAQRTIKSCEAIIARGEMALKHGWYSEDEDLASNAAINAHNDMRDAARWLDDDVMRECNHWEKRPLTRPLY